MIFREELLCAWLASVNDHSFLVKRVRNDGGSESEELMTEIGVTKYYQIGIPLRNA